MDDATYFITFRLADSLPKAVLDQIVSERERIDQTARQQGREISASERQHLKRLTTVRIEQYLDSSSGKCSLSVPNVAAIVADTLLLFDEKRYRLFAWCIMPNHVHAVVKIFPANCLADVLHSWKSYTSRQANRILATRGIFWQREYYDHLLRDQVQFERAVGYVLENPVKANLQNWEWVWVRGQGARATAGGGAGATVES
jgi:menaquinone-specific isochorismate synthase